MTEADRVWRVADVDAAPSASTLLAVLAARGETLAFAESLTGGLLAAAFTDVAGSSRVVRGGVVAYATDVKASVLGVDAELLAAGGAVQAEVAERLAAGVRRLLDATWGIGTTGVAGPDPADGQPAGTVFVAVAGPGTSGVRRLDLAGLDRAGVRAGSVGAALRLLNEQLSA